MSEPLNALDVPLEAGRMQEIKEIILAAGDLPTLPLVALEVTRQAENPLTSLPEMVRLIRNDPPLTARILRAANSEYYGMPQRIDSLNMAIVVLGMREISNLVTSISVLRTFPESPHGMGLDTQVLWEHSAGCAEIARVLAGKLNLHFHDAEFTAGLLHDVGKLVLDQHFHEDLLRAQELEAAEQIPSSDAERRVIGVDHAEIGAWLAELWSLPPAIAGAIRHHHHPQFAEANQALAGMVYIADLLANAILHEQLRSPVNEQLFQDPVWDLLAASNPEIRNLDIATFTADLEENIERARHFTRMAGITQNP